MKLGDGKAMMASSQRKLGSYFFAIFVVIL